MTRLGLYRYCGVLLVLALVTNGRTDDTEGDQGQGDTTIAVTEAEITTEASTTEKPDEKSNHSSATGSASTMPGSIGTSPAPSTQPPVTQKQPDQSTAPASPTSKVPVSDKPTEPSPMPPAPSTCPACPVCPLVTCPPPMSTAAPTPAPKTNNDTKCNSPELHDIMVKHMSSASEEDLRKWKLSGDINSEAAKQFGGGFLTICQDTGEYYIIYAYFDYRCEVHRGEKGNGDYTCLTIRAYV